MGYLRGKANIQGSQMLYGSQRPGTILPIAWKRGAPGSAMADAVTMNGPHHAFAGIFTMGFRIETCFG